VIRLETEISDVISLAQSYDLLTTTDSVRKLLDFMKTVVSGREDFKNEGKKVVCEVKKSGSFSLSESFVSLSVLVETVKDFCCVVSVVESLKKKYGLGDVVKTRAGEWIRDFLKKEKEEKERSFAFVLSLIFPLRFFEKGRDDEKKNVPVKVLFELGSSLRLVLNEVYKEGEVARYREVVKEPFWTWWWKYEKQIFVASFEVFKSFLKKIEPVLSEVGSGSLINHEEHFLKLVEEAYRIPFQSLEDYDFLNVVVKKLFDVESFKRFSSEFLNEIVKLFLEDFSEEKDRKKEKEEREFRLKDYRLEGEEEDEDEDLGILLE